MCYSYICPILSEVRKQSVPGGTMGPMTSFFFIFGGAMIGGGIPLAIGSGDSSMLIIGAVSMSLSALFSSIEDN